MACDLVCVCRELRTDHFHRSHHQLGQTRPSNLSAFDERLLSNDYESCDDGSQRTRCWTWRLVFEERSNLMGRWLLCFSSSLDGLDFLYAGVSGGNPHLRFRSVANDPIGESAFVYELIFERLSRRILVRLRRMARKHSELPQLRASREDRLEVTAEGALECGKAWWLCGT